MYPSRHVCEALGLPRAHVDPIIDPFDALRLILQSMSAPPRHETIVMLLDANRCGHVIMIIDHTDDADKVLSIVETMVDGAQGDPDASGLIVASIRPGTGVGYDDLARWDEMNRYCDDSGMELVEWFVVGTSIQCPRDLCGTAPRWVH